MMDYLIFRIPAMTRIDSFINSMISIDASLDLCSHNLKLCDFDSLLLLWA